MKQTQQKQPARRQKGKAPTPAGPNRTVLRELSRLPELTIPELKEQYRSLFGKPPPFHTQAFLIKRIAYRLQEIAHGGVSAAAHMKMTALLQKHGMAEDGFPPKGKQALPKGKNRRAPEIHPGTVLRRNWDGVTHEVLVERDAFVWQGQRYASLSKVAREITGTNWNGPRFFGLRNQTKAPAQEGGAE